MFCIAGDYRRRRERRRRRWSDEAACRFRITVTLPTADGLRTSPNGAALPWSPRHLAVWVVLDIHECLRRRPGDGGAAVEELGGWRRRGACRPLRGRPPATSG